MKMRQVKGAGAQSAPTPANIAPQCGSEGIFLRGQKLPLGVGFGVVQRGKASFTAEKGSPERGHSRSCYFLMLLPAENATHL